MRLLVFGSRTYGVPPFRATQLELDIASEQRAFFVSSMKLFHRAHDITHIIAGGAKGADTWASLFSNKFQIPYTEFPANWPKYGKTAGPVRNMQMITEGKPDHALGYIDRRSKDMPISAGSRNMYELCLKHNVPVELVT